jgi:hypothetical protein
MSFRLLRRGLPIFLVHLQAGYETFHTWIRWLVGRPQTSALLVMSGNQVECAGYREWTQRSCPSTIHGNLQAHAGYLVHCI